MLSIVAVAALGAVAFAQTPGDTIVMGAHTGPYAGVSCTYFESATNGGSALVDSAVAIGAATGSCQNWAYYTNLAGAAFRCLESDDSTFFSCGTSISGSFLSCPTAQTPCSDVCDNLLVFRCSSSENCAQSAQDDGSFVSYELMLFDTDGAANTDCGTDVGGGAGVVGDPLVMDFAGHSFIAGNGPNTEYLLYKSGDGTEAITITTGDQQGSEDGYFAVKTKVTRESCGTVEIEAGPHTSKVTGSLCMTSLIARGDEGMVLVPMSSGTVVAVNPHPYSKDHPTAENSFVNVKVLNPTTEFRAGCQGMLCNEDHADVVV